MQISWLQNWSLETRNISFNSEAENVGRIKDPIFVFLLGMREGEIS